MKILFNEIPVAIITASDILPSSSARDYIKIYLNYQDETAWQLISNLKIFSNSRNNSIMIRENIHDENTLFYL
jgi:hypothetical protein